MLRRALRGMVYTKDYVKFISVMTDSGELVFYNQLTSATTRTSWMDSISMSQEELYREISADNISHTIPTGDQVVFGSNSCYLFHIGRRIIDYRDVDKRCGIVLVSIDEKLLEEICSTTENGLNFIVDSEGTLISCVGSGRVGQTVYDKGASADDKRAAYLRIARETTAAAPDFYHCPVTLYGDDDYVWPGDKNDGVYQESCGDDAEGGQGGSEHPCGKGSDAPDGD